MVNGRDLLGDVHGVHKWKQQDGCRQFHVPRLRGQPRQHRQRLEVLEWINQIMMRPTVDIESGIPRGAELLQLVLPLLLQADRIPVDDLTNLVSDFHCVPFLSAHACWRPEWRS